MLPWVAPCVCMTLCERVCVCVCAVRYGPYYFIADVIGINTVNPAATGVRLCAPCVCSFCVCASVFLLCVCVQWRGTVCLRM